MYFRCVSEDKGRSFREVSGGLYEKVSDEGELVETETGLTEQSEVPEICCSKSPEAALLGALQNRQVAGTYHVYETRSTPDVDVSGAEARDFEVLEEVRFRPDSMPVEFVHYASVNVPRDAVTDVQEAYGRGRFSKSDVRDVKEKLAGLFESGLYG